MPPKNGLPFPSDGNITTCLFLLSAVADVANAVLGTIPFLLPSSSSSSVVLRLQNIENLFCAITTAAAAADGHSSSGGMGEAISADGKTDVALRASVFVPPHPPRLRDRLFVGGGGALSWWGKIHPPTRAGGLGLWWAIKIHNEAVRCLKSG